jgi:hypothetical protein
MIDITMQRRTVGSGLLWIYLKNHTWSWIPVKKVFQKCSCYVEQKYGRFEDDGVESLKLPGLDGSCTNEHDMDVDVQANQVQTMPRIRYSIVINHNSNLWFFQEISQIIGAFLPPAFPSCSFSHYICDIMIGPCHHLALDETLPLGSPNPMLSQCMSRCMLELPIDQLLLDTTIPLLKCDQIDRGLIERMQTLWNW